MTSPLYQINMALSVIDNVRERTLKVGSMEPSFRVEASDYQPVRKIFHSLRAKGVFTKSVAIAEIEKLLSGNAENVFDDLRKIRMIIPEVKDKSRYARHQLYYAMSGVDHQAQEELKKRSVLLIGAGGIGSTCATLLAVAGVGRLILADSDVVELSNLTRTILFQASDIGKQKTPTAKAHILARNPEVTVETLDGQLSKPSFDDYVIAARSADMMILSGDSGPEVHRLSYKISKQFGIPLINAGYIETWGIVGPLTVGENSAREADLGSLESSQQQNRQLNENYFAASYGPLNTMVSSMAVNEVIRYFLGQKVRSYKRRLVINSHNYKTRIEKWD